MGRVRRGEERDGEGIAVDGVRMFRWSALAEIGGADRTDRNGHQGEK